MQLLRMRKHCHVEAYSIGQTDYVTTSGVDTGGSGGSMNRGPRPPGGHERYNMIFYITCNMEK